MSKLPNIIPVFPLSNFILFPKTSVPLNIFEPRYIEMFNESMKKEKLIGMIQPKNSSDFNVVTPALYEIGCLGKITSFKESDDGRYLVDLKGIIRFKISNEIKSNKSYRECEVNYDTYINEEELQSCDKTICEIANSLSPKPHTSREFIWELGKYLKEKSIKKNSLIETAYNHSVPIFCPAFTDSSAGFGLVMHQEQNPDSHLTIDSIREFRELTEIKVKSKKSGLFMVGGGVPKNFIQDTVICAELLGKDVEMHKYAIQITVADSRDGACSSSTLKEASSWGKVDTTKEQMVFAEATSVLPLIVSDAYHRMNWKNRTRRNFSKIFDK